MRRVCLALDRRCECAARCRSSIARKIGVSDHSCQLYWQLQKSTDDGGSRTLPVDNLSAGMAEPSRLRSSAQMFRLSAGPLRAGHHQVSALCRSPQTILPQTVFWSARRTVEGAISNQGWPPHRPTRRRSLSRLDRWLRKRAAMAPSITR